MKPWSFPCRLSVLTLLSLVFTSAFSADPPAVTGAGPTSVTPAILKAKIKEVKATADLDEATTAKLTELYSKALSSLETAASQDAAAKAFVQARQTAPAEAKSVREALEKVQEAPPKQTLKISDKTPLAEIEQLLLKEKADLAAVEAKLAGLNKQLAAEAERPNAVRQRLTEAKQLQENIASELKLPPPAGELPKLTEARRWRLETKGLALSAEVGMLDQELLSQPMRVELLKAQRDRTAHSVESVSARARLLEGVQNQRRLSEAEQAKAETEAAKRDAIGKHPVVQRLAEDNAALSGELQSLAANLERVTAANETAAKEAKRIEEVLRYTRQKLELAGLSQALGRVLLEQRRSLPNLQLYRKQARVREALVAEAGLRQIQNTEERRHLRKLDDYVAGLTGGLTPEEAIEIEDELRDLAQSRRELLDKAIAGDAAYLRAMGELDFVQRRLIEVISAYEGFLDENLLWIRSTTPFNLEALRTMPQEIALLLSPVSWFEVVNGLASRAVQSPIPALGLGLIAILVWKTRRLREVLRATRTNLGNPDRDRFYTSLQALGLTLLIAAPWPLLLALLGWQLGQLLEPPDFSKAIGLALLWTAPRFYSLQVFRGLCAAKGLAAAHFRWPEPSLKLLRRELDRLMVIFLPASFITVTIIELNPVTVGGGQGKLAYALAVGALAFFLYRVLHPSKGVLGRFLRENPKRLLGRLRHLWFPLIVGMPLVFAGLALAGYSYTAATLTELMIDTLWLVLGLVVVHQLSIRWLLMTRRQLAHKAALEEWEEALAEAQAEETEHGAEEGLSMEVEEPEVDLAALSQESRKLLNLTLLILGITGLWFIWSPVLPAFGILDEVSLWYHTAVVEGEEKRLPVTLADLGLAVLIVVVTVVAAKRLPALLEIVLLQRIDMTSGGRYAATTLAGYTIAAAGALLAFNTIGASWSQVQWLVAALGVGIGFGLAEIVTNFISGLIILFERPIRVGDFVTVGDSDGVVTRIRIRATTILTRDRKELLVPNKEFITGRLLNWSLSDQTTRIILPVGVAYGSDVRKAMGLMVEAAEEHQEVLEEPTPVVTFESFGDNALGLNLRCFVGSTDVRLSTISDLHEAINDKFNAAGIVIAFPQRDLHLDTGSGPLDIRIHGDGGGRGGAGESPAT